MQILITERQTIYAQVEGANFQGVFCDGSVEFNNNSCWRSSIGGKGIFRLILTNFTCTNCVRQNNQIKMLVFLEILCQKSYF